MQVDTNKLCSYFDKMFNLIFFLVLIFELNISILCFPSDCLSKVYCERHASCIVSCKSSYYPIERPYFFYRALPDDVDTLQIRNMSNQTIEELKVTDKSGTEGVVIASPLPDAGSYVIEAIITAPVNNVVASSQFCVGMY